MENVPVSSVQQQQLLSMGSLRDNLHNHLRETGALSTLKTQLRAMVLSEITKSSRNADNILAADGSGGGTSMIAGGKKSASAALIAADANAPSGGTMWSAQLANRLVESHLRNSKRAYSHNIFVSESGIELGDANSIAAADAELCAAIDVPLPTAAAASNASSSPLVALIAKVLHSRCVPTRQSTSIQTDSFTNSSVSDGTLTVEQKLALVDAQHALKYAHVDHASKAMQEQRFRQYKEELETELRREMEHKLLVFRNGELADVRRQEAERYQLLISHKGQEMAEMERSVQHRMELERARLEAAKHDLEVHRQAVDKRGRDMFALAEEREHSVAHLERLIGDQKGTIQKLHLQLTQLEDLCATRAQEVESWRLREHRRTEDLRRVAAEHMSELRVKDEELSEMRYKNKVMQEEYRHHLDRMSLDVRMVYQNGMTKMQQQQQQPSNAYVDPTAAGMMMQQQPPQEAVHPYDNAVMEANRYPDYKTLLSQGRPVGAASQEKEKEYQLPLHAVAAKYLPQQQQQQNNVQQQQQQTATTPSMAAYKSQLGQQQQPSAAAYTAPPQQQQQQHVYQQPAQYQQQQQSAPTTSAAAPSHSQPQQQYAPHAAESIPVPKPVEVKRSAVTNNTVGVRLSISPTRGVHQNSTAATSATTAAAQPNSVAADLRTPPRAHEAAPAATLAASAAQQQQMAHIAANTTAATAGVMSPIPKGAGDRSPSSARTQSSSTASSSRGREAVSLSRSPINSHSHVSSSPSSLPHVQRRKSPILPASNTSPASRHSSSSSPSSSAEKPKARPVLDAQKAQQEAEQQQRLRREAEEREREEADKRRQQNAAASAERLAEIAQQLTVTQSQEADARRSLTKSCVDDFNSTVIMRHLPEAIFSAVKAEEDNAFRAILWSHDQAMTLMKARDTKEEVFVYGGGDTALARDSDDSDGGFNIYGRGSDDSDSDF